MNNGSNESNAPQIEHAEQWSNFVLEKDEATGMAVLIRRSKKNRGHIYSLQLGSVRHGDNRLTSYIPLYFDKDSLNMASERPVLTYDYVSAISNLVTKAILAVLTAKTKEHLANRDAIVERDLERVRRAPKKPITRQEIAAAATKSNGAKRG